MASHLECAAATVWETAILISIRLCLSSLSTHKSLLQSEINSYWSALISRVRREGGRSDWNWPSLTPPKTSFCLWNSGVMWCSSAADTDRENDGAWSGRSPVSRSTTTHTHTTHTPHTPLSQSEKKPKINLQSWRSWRSNISFNAQMTLTPSVIHEVFRGLQTPSSEVVIQPEFLSC